MGLPTEAYHAVEEVHDVNIQLFTSGLIEMLSNFELEQDGTPTSKTFEHLASEIGAEEAEEVGVEHLLRDVKDTTVGTLSQRITAQLLGLKGLLKQIRHIHEYLEQVIET